MGHDCVGRTKMVRRVDLSQGRNCSVVCPTPVAREFRKGQETTGRDRVADGIAGRALCRYHGATLGS